MAIHCGWEVRVTHSSGQVKCTCGLDRADCTEKRRENCTTKTKCRKAYDLPVKPEQEGKVLMQAGDRIYPKLKSK